MKKAIMMCAVAAVLACACTTDKPTETYIPKNTVEFAGNAFKAFSLGSDVKLYTVQNPQNNAEWTVQAVVPVRKEVSEPIGADLSIDLVPLDDHGVRVRDGLVLVGEDLPNLIPVYNGGENVERVIVFSVLDESKKFMTANDAAQLLENTKGVRMNFNVSEPSIVEQAAAVVEQTVAAVTNAMTAPAAQPAAVQPAAPKAPKEYPMTLDGLCRKYGVYGLLSQYDRALRNDNGKAAKNIEDQLWAIEKRVKNDGAIPKALREQFEDYIEDKEDEIEDRY